MARLGDALEAAHGARERLPALQAVVRHWHHRDRTERAWRRYSEGKPDVAAIRSIADGPVPETSQWQAQIWVRGDSSRVEQELLVDGRPQRRIAVIHDGRRSFYHPGHGAFEVKFDPEMVGFEYEHMLDPPILLAHLALELTEQVPWEGRAAYRLRGRLRRGASPVLTGLTPLADEYELLVDAELGVLLRVGSRFEGEEFAALELRALRADIDPPPAIFVLELPAGETIQRIPPPAVARPSSRNWFTVEEVAAVAPFKLLVPAGIATARARATLVQPTGQPPSEAVAYLFYDLPAALDLAERVARPAPEGPDWEPMTFQGLAVLVRRRHPGGRHELYVSRHGTEALLSSDLELVKLLVIARSLVPRGGPDSLTEGM